MLGSRSFSSPVFTVAADDKKNLTDWDLLQTSSLALCTDIINNHAVSHLEVKNEDLWTKSPNLLRWSASVNTVQPASGSLWQYPNFYAKVAILLTPHKSSSWITFFCPCTSKILSVTQQHQSYHVFKMPINQRSACGGIWAETPL